jgi:hypothetical protein
MFKGVPFVQIEVPPNPAGATAGFTRFIPDDVMGDQLVPQIEHMLGLDGGDTLMQGYRPGSQGEGTTRLLLAEFSMVASVPEGFEQQQAQEPAAASRQGKADELLLDEFGGASHAGERQDRTILPTVTWWML